MDLLMAVFDQQHIQTMFNSVDGADQTTLCSHWGNHLSVGMLLMQYVHGMCVMVCSCMYQQRSLFMIDKKIKNLGILLGSSDFCWHSQHHDTKKRCDSSNPFILKLTELQRKTICVVLAGIYRLTNHAWPVLTSLPPVWGYVLHFFNYWNVCFFPLRSVMDTKRLIVNVR